MNGLAVRRAFLILSISLLGCAFTGALFTPSVSEDQVYHTIDADATWGRARNIAVEQLATGMRISGTERAAVVQTGPGSFSLGPDPEGSEFQAEAVGFTVDGRTGAAILLISVHLGADSTVPARAPGDSSSSFNPAMFGFVPGAPGSENVSIRVNPDVGHTQVAGLRFRQEVVLNVWENGIVELDREQVTVLDTNGREWISKNVRIEGRTAILLIRSEGAASTPRTAPTATPTSTPSPTPAPAPMLAGRITGSPELDLEGTWIVLCRKTSDSVCVVERELSTMTDREQAFRFYDIPPGEYFVLYNPFPIANTVAYWQYWDRRTLDFSSRPALGNSLGDVPATATIDGRSGDLVLQITEYPMVIELLARDQDRPPSVTITAGQTSEMTIQARAAALSSAPVATPSPTSMPAPTPTSTASSIGDSQRWRTVISDSFDNNRNDWPIARQAEDDFFSSITLQISRGAYRWEGRARRDAVYWAYPAGESVTDLYLAVTLRQVSGVDDAAAGVIFRLGGNAYYSFRIAPGHQTYAIDLQRNDEWTTLTEWTYTSAIVSDGWNRIEVEAIGTSFAFRINGSLVDRVSDSTLTRGRVGLIMELFDQSDQAVFEFDDFELRVPER